VFVLGIAGGSGSGKSTFVAVLKAKLGGRVAHLPHDAYYRNRGDMPPAVREAPNWDHPEALETELYLQHLDELKAGRAIDVPEYDFDHHARKPESRRLEPAPAILVEGILVLAVPAIRERLDLKLFIDTPADLRLLRRFQRDAAERGRSSESILEQYLATVRPMHAEYVEPSRAFADLIVPWETRNFVAVELAAEELRRRSSM